MNTPPLVSIVIPVYNGSNYVGAAIESALDQTYPHTEVIVVNDGSADGGATRAVAEQFGKRIRYIEKPNGGVASALNAGIAAMRGDLFSWLSHDDLYRPWKVERQVAAWHRFGPRCVVIGDFETMDEHGTPKDVITLAGRNLVARPLDAVFCGLINGCALLVPRLLFKEAGVFELGLPTTQDYHLWYRLARIVPFVHCAGAGVRQRIHDLQGSRQFSHLEEASRMFAHLVEATPMEVMQAYEGSELRFLLLLQRRLGGVYPGLRAYLDGRIATVFLQLRYAVIWTAAPSDPAAAARHLAAYQPASVTVSSPGPDGPADMAHAAEAEIAVLLPPDRPPSATQLRAALEAFVLADVDVARPAGTPAMLGGFDGLLARPDVLAELAHDQSAGMGRLRTIAYPAVPSEADLAGAFEGKATYEYHSYLSLPALTSALAARLRPGFPAILFLVHSIGGGIWTHLQRLAALMSRQVDCLIGSGGPDGVFRVCKLGPQAGGGGIVFHLPGHAAELARILPAIGVVRVDVHSTYGFDSAAEALLDALALPVDITLLDYHLMASDPHLRLPDGRFAEGAERPEQWRQLWRGTPSRLLGRADRVFAVSRDMVARLQAVGSGPAVIYAPPWPDAKGRVTHVFEPIIRNHEPLRVILVGTLTAHKGKYVILDAAREASRRGLPLLFHHLGESELSPADRQDLPPSLILHGTFGPHALGERLNAIAPHIGWIPSQVPETWSYVLSEFMEACLPVAACAIGALVERCHGRAATWLLPWHASGKEWANLFLTLHATRLRHPPQWVPVDHLPHPKPAELDDYLRPVLAATQPGSAQGRTTENVLEAR